MLYGMPWKMKTAHDCIPCLIRQTLNAVRPATPDEKVHISVLREALQAVSTMDLDFCPPLMGSISLCKLLLSRACILFTGPRYSCKVFRRCKESIHSSFSLVSGIDLQKELAVKLTEFFSAPQIEKFRRHGIEHPGIAGTPVPHGYKENDKRYGDESMLW
jgi:hypothetical protein